MKTKTLIWILCIWLLSLAIMMLVSGCKTKTVTEYVAVHDTLLSVSHDTLVKVKTEYSHDTLRIEVEKIVTINEGGDTIRVAVFRDRWRDRIVNKTDTVLKHTTDTIYRVVESEREKTTVKGETWWERWRWKLAALAALCAVLYALWRSSKENIKKWLKRWFQ